MMNILKSAIILSIIFATSCTKEEIICTDCIDRKLQEHQMVAYDGQDIDCKLYLEYYEYDGKQFFLLGNYCSDLISMPEDCYGTKICNQGDDFQCRLFFANASRIKIVGVKE